ncbi:MAG: diadenylate cyclase CdaA [Oscillospiraceae bacterium]|nr:diadenylate cyclase CdaA [Oscillospiraceae bacterium]
MLDFINDIFNVLKTLQLKDIFLDILPLTVIIYLLLRLIRETRAAQLLKGIALLIIVWALSDLADLKAIHFLADTTIKAGAVVIVVIFQPELRRILERFGQSTSSITRMAFGEDETVIARWERAIPATVAAVTQLSKTNTGALIIIERSTMLGEQLRNGTILKARASAELFGTIFFPKTPLHDGAVVMRDGYIWAAACFLPKPQKEELIDKHLGSRHRAAIGMSENSDAIIIVVSEETGQISVARDGKIKRDYTPDSLEEYLRSLLIPAEDDIFHSRKRRFSFLRRGNVKAEEEEEKKWRNIQ